MAYPFLLMVSGSIKSRVDVQDLDLIPKFLHDDALLYSKYTEAKYNERILDYRLATGDSSRNFREVELPVPGPSVVLEDWQEFLETEELPVSWYLTGFGPTLDGKIIQKNERLFREFVSQSCDNDLEVFRERYDESIESWFFLKFPHERLADKNFQLGDTPLTKLFYEFKSQLALDDRIYTSCDRYYQHYLDLIGEDSAGRILSARSDDSVWEAFMREFLHPQFILVSPSALPDWQAFLKRKHISVENLNELYGSDYKGFESVAFPEDKITTSAHLTDYVLFVSSPEDCRVQDISLDTPELRWREFLREKYGSISVLAETYGADYEQFEDVYMPQQQLDARIVTSNGSELRWQFSTNNYRMVLEYILLYGNGVKNTFIYCLLSIALALIVNPLAAYSLSRYQLREQYKVLLFLIATMAFPGVVTMIPNFLLLRDLGLLNTFAALLLPTMANGYSIFLLKGFFDSLPKELFEAAELDGASEWQKFWMITMNLSKPILAVIALGAFNAAYSNFMYAFVLCQDKDMWTLTVWLYQLQQFSSQGVVFASLVVAAVPTLLVFIFCQKLIIKGIVVPTEK
jgi:multiple sugar transport system permease protein